MGSTKFVGICAFCVWLVYACAASPRPTWITAIPTKLTEADLERLILEASTYFDPDSGHDRVSEARAISDLMIVATAPDAGMIRSAARAVSAPRVNPRTDALERLYVLAFTFWNDSPGQTNLLPLTVTDGKLHLNRVEESRRSTFGPKYDFVAHKRGSGPTERRDLRPFLGQVMTATQYAADTVTTGEQDPMPLTHAPNPALVKHLTALMEDAIATRDDRRYTSDQLAVALTSDSYAIREAGRAIVVRYKLMDRAGRVLQPLWELLFGTSKVDKRYDCTLQGWVVDHGAISLSGAYGYYGTENYKWVCEFDATMALWNRRDLRAFKGQVLPISKVDRTPFAEIRLDQPRLDDKMRT